MLVSEIVIDVFKCSGGNVIHMTKRTHRAPGRRPFWTNENMRTCAFKAIKRRNLKPTLEIKKAFRYHYQRLADMGAFSAPTSWELAKIGIDTSTWNEGEGWLPQDMKLRWKDLEEGRISSFDDDNALPADAGPKPPRGVSRSALERETVDAISESGPRFSKAKPRGKEEKPRYTGRRWKGEHYDSATKTWELRDGEWWNPRAQAWEPGKPRLGPFYWIWEFYHDPSRYSDPVDLGDIHEKILNRMEQERRACIKIARDHLKTTMFNRGYMLYYACERPDLARAGILNVAWDAGLAEETYLDVSENLAENERVLSFYGYIIDDHMPKTQEKLYFVYQGVGAKFGMRCTSFKSGSITGAHPYLVIIDDPQDEPLSEKLMAKFRLIINKKLTPAVGKAGKIMVTGTIKGWNKENDIYIWLEGKKDWTNLRYPAANRMPPLEDIFTEKREREETDPETGFTRTISYLHVEVKDREQYKTLYPERYQIEDLVRKMFEMMEDGKSPDDFWAEYFLVATNPAGKYFLKHRVGEMPPAGFYSTLDFVDRCKTHQWHAPICMFIDPGGAKSHGIAVVIGCTRAGRYYFLDFKTIREGPSEAAKIIARMIAEWRVDKWACESNFSQATTYADTLDIFIKQELAEMGALGAYSPVVKIQNTGEKYQRIQTHMANMLGMEGQDTTLFANKQSKGWIEFENQLTNFGAGLPKSREHDFDLLDCAASLKGSVFKELGKRAVGYVI